MNQDHIYIPKKTEEFLFKILVVGDPGVGKTSFVHRYTAGIYSDAYKSTIGVDFASKRVKLTNSIIVDVHLWDLAGQERLGSQVKLYFRQTDAAICLYDITDRKSFDRALEWKNIVCENSTHPYTKEAYFPPCILLANKFDLIPQEEITDLSVLNEKAKEMGFISGTVVSAKENRGIDEAMIELLTLLIERRRQDELNGIKQDGCMVDIVDLADSTPVTTAGRTGGYYSCSRC